MAKLEKTSRLNYSHHSQYISWLDLTLMVPISGIIMRFADKALLHDRIKPQTNCWQAGNFYFRFVRHPLCYVAFFIKRLSDFARLGTHWSWLVLVYCDCGFGCLVDCSWLETTSRPSGIFLCLVRFRLFDTGHRHRSVDRHLAGISFVCNWRLSDGGSTLAKPQKMSLCRTRTLSRLWTLK